MKNKNKKIVGKGLTNPDLTREEELTIFVPLLLETLEKWGRVAVGAITDGAISCALCVGHQSIEDKQERGRNKKNSNCFCPLRSCSGSHYDGKFNYAAVQDSDCDDEEYRETSCQFLDRLCDDYRMIVYNLLPAEDEPLLDNLVRCYASSLEREIEVKINKDPHLSITFNGDIIDLIELLESIENKYSGMARAQIDFIEE